MNGWPTLKPPIKQLGKNKTLMPLDNSKPKNSQTRDRLAVWEEFARTKRHILGRGDEEWPANKILLQLASEHAQDSPVTEAAEVWLKEDASEWMWLRQMRLPEQYTPDPCIRVMEGHTGGVVGVIALTNSKILSWARGQWPKECDDYSLRLWDIETGQCKSVLEGHCSPIRDVMQLNNGRILSWSGDHSGHNDSIKLWDEKSGECLNTLEGHNGQINGFIQLQNGHILSWGGDCSSGKDYVLKIWDADDGSLISTLYGHEGPIGGAIESADGRLISYSSAQKQRMTRKNRDRDAIRVWDQSTGKCLQIIPMKSRGMGVRYVQQLQNGKFIVMAGYRDMHIFTDDFEENVGTIERFTYKSGRLDIGQQICGLQQLENGNLFGWVSGNLGSDQHINDRLVVFDQNSGDLLDSIDGHTDEFVDAMEIENNIVLSWAKDGVAKAWDMNSLKCASTFIGHTHTITGATTLTDGRLLTWSKDGTIRFWDMESGDCLSCFPGHMNGINGAKEFSNGRIISWSEDFDLRLWDADEVHSHPATKGHEDEILGTLKIEDGRILSWAEESKFCLWDPKIGMCQTILKGHTKKVNGAKQLRNGHILSWSFDDTLRLWNAKTDQSLSIFEGHKNSVQDAQQLRDGSILSYSWDHTLRIWDENTTHCKAVFEGHTGAIKGALQLENGQILSWAQDRTLRVWDALTGQSQKVLKGHSGIVWGARQLDNSHILSWSSDNAVKLWAHDSEQCLVTYEGHTEEVEDACQLENGNIFSISGDGTFREWDINGCQLGRWTLEEAKDNFDLRLKVKNNFFPELVEGPAEIWHKSSLGTHPKYAIGCRFSDELGGELGYALWEGPGDWHQCHLLAEGKIVVTCHKSLEFLSLYIGRKRVTLAEARQLLELAK
jgi:WD40 repeat protein